MVRSIAFAQSEGCEDDSGEREKPHRNQHEPVFPAALPAPLEGREAIRGFAKNWPRVVNVEEWRVLEGDRFSIGWNERHFDAEPDDVYRGISTFRFAPNGEILDYEGFFDPAKVAANYRRAVERERG